MQAVSEDARAALTGPRTQVKRGVDLLDANDRVVEDISADVDSFTVERDMYADVHGACSMVLRRDLRWGVDRVRPWFAVWDGRTRDEAGDPVWHRWNLGVFLLTSPDRDGAETPYARAVTGVDKLWLLQRNVGDTYVVDAGTSYLDAIRQVLTDAGLSVRLLLQGDRQETVLDQSGVWLLTDQGPTWLRVINDLLGMIGYRGLWVDEQGRFRSEPYRAPGDRAAEWEFDTTDRGRDITHEDRSLSADVYDAPNWWRFVRKQDSRPVEGDGVYTVDRTGGLSAERVRRRVVFLDAADQESLVSQGDQVVAEDTQAERVVSFGSGPLPAGHFDIVRITDSGLGLFGARAQVRRWALDNDAQLSWEAEVL